MRKRKDERGFISLLGLLLAMAIIFFIGYKAYSIYLTKPSVDKQTKRALSEQGMDASNNQGAFQSTTQKVTDIKKMIQGRANQLPDDAQ